MGTFRGMFKVFCHSVGNDWLGNIREKCYKNNIHMIITRVVIKEFQGSRVKIALGDILVNEL